MSSNSKPYNPSQEQNFLYLPSNRGNSPPTKHSNIIDLSLLDCSQDNPSYENHSFSQDPLPPHIHNRFKRTHLQDITSTLNQSSIDQQYNLLVHTMQPQKDHSEISVLKQYGEQLLKQSQTQVEAVVKKVKEKNTLLKDKVKQQKEVIQEMAKERSEVLRRNTELVDQVNMLQEELIQTRHTLQSKSQEIEAYFQQRLLDQQSGATMQITQLQKDYQKMMDDRLQEFNTRQTLQVQRQQYENDELRQQLQQKIKAYEREYIKVADHESLVNKEIIEITKQHKIKINEIKNKVKEQFVKEYGKEYEGKAQEYDQKLKQLQEELEKVNQVVFDQKRGIREEIEKREEAEWRLEKTHRQMEQRDEECQQFEQQNQYLENELQQLSQYSQQMELELKSQVEQLQGENEEKGEQIHQQENLLAQLQANLTLILQEKNSQDKSTMTALQDKDQLIQDLSQNLEEGKTLIQQQRLKIEEQLTSLEQMKHAHQSLQDNYSQLQEHYQNQQAYIDYQQDSIQNIHLQFVLPMRDELSALRNDYLQQQQDFSQSITIAYTFLSQITKKLDKQATLCSLQKTQIVSQENEYYDQVMSLQALLKDHKTDKLHLEEKVDSLTKENIQVLKQRSECESRNQVLKGKIDTLVNDYTKLREVYEKKVDRVKAKCLSLLKEVQTQAKAQQKSIAKTLTQEIQDLKARYTEQLDGLNCALQHVQGQFSMEYRSISSKYESEYDQLKHNVEMEKQKMQMAQSQLSLLSQTNVKELDQYEKWKQDKAKELEHIHVQVKELVCQLEERSRDMQTMKFTYNEMKSKYKKIIKDLQRSVGDKDKEIDEMHSMLKNCIKLNRQHQSMLVENSERFLSISSHNAHSLQSPCFGNQGETKRSKSREKRYDNYQSVRDESKRLSAYSLRRSQERKKSSGKYEPERE